MSVKPSGKLDTRMRVGHKAFVNKEEGRRRRHENIVEIRKNKRAEGLLKKRREGNTTLHNSSNILSSLVTSVMSQNSTALLDAATRIRELVARENQPPIDEVVKSGVVPRFVDFLQRVDMPQLQFEAAWALTNIASGTSEHTTIVVECGAVPLFVQLLCSPNVDLREQAIWALGNISGDSKEYRDLVLSHGGMMKLLAQFNEHAKLSLLRNATWTLSNFCRGKPPPPFDQAKAALSTLRRLLQTIDEEILADACWAISYISDGSIENIQAVIDAGVCSKLAQLLMHSSIAVLVPALRITGNIATGSDVQTQHLIDNQALPCLRSLITSGQKLNIKKEACWTISNITAGNKDQLQAVIDANIIPPLVWLLANAEFDIRKEVAWAVCNATSIGTPEQIEYLVREGCVQPLCDLLACPDASVVSVCLEGLENLLKSGNNGGHNNKFASLLEDAGGVDKIEQLQQHKNCTIYEKAVKILENYFADEEEDEHGDVIDFSIPSGVFNFN